MRDEAGSAREQSPPDSAAPDSVAPDAAAPDMVRPEAPSGPPARPRRSVRAFARGVFRWVRRFAAAATLAVIFLGVLGQVVRDVSGRWALLMYIPLPLVGLGAALQDLIFAGRSLPRPRFALAIIGLLTAALSAWPMLGRGPDRVAATSAPDSAGQVTVLHWNVKWGGGWAKGPPWDSIVAQIAAKVEEAGVDLIILSESPEEGRLPQLARALGPRWTHVARGHDVGSPNWYRLAVLSERPLRLERFTRVTPTNGCAMTVLAQLRDGRRLRLLVVDGRSDLLLHRTPFLSGVAAECDAAAARGEPVDLIAGDFNSVSRSRGFDAFPTTDAAAPGEGYALAGRATRGWRATWPAPLPMYDIDHVWVRKGLPVLGCELFSNEHTDHRGQVVILRLPGIMTALIRAEGPPSGRSPAPSATNSSHTRSFSPAR